MKHDEVRLNPASTTIESIPTPNPEPSESGPKKGSNRRTFLGQVGLAAGVAAGALAAPGGLCGAAGWRHGRGRRPGGPEPRQCSHHQGDGPARR